MSDFTDDRELIHWVRDARQRTCELVADLLDEQLMGPKLDIINPLRWEIGHVGWFQEKWILRRSPGAKSVRPDADALYDSAAIPHDTRWDLPLPDRQVTLRYLNDVCERVVELIEKGSLGEEDWYFIMLSVFHEDMHDEAFLYTRQTLGYPPPRSKGAGVRSQTRGGEGNESEAQRLASGVMRHGSEDVQIPSGTFWLGAFPGEGFVFDNEKWAHKVEVAPFAIGRTAVTQEQFAAFADAGGYRESRFWSEAGWRWRLEVDAQHPIHWQRETNGRWLRRNFDRWLPLEANLPVLHVNYHEAEAYCNWAGRRLPTEAEWEVAAADEKAPDARCKRRYPWGNEAPDSSRANLDALTMGCLDVNDLAAGDSFWGCRQLFGNVWEWTASDFLPYPGFVPDPYQEYSAPWFGTHKVLRGGCWATRARLIRNTWRNFYRPERRDIWAGFRTCAARA
jgi:iron(II)-dependent oxidoreductase